MQLFITRVWGFDPKLWPVIAFSKPGDRNKLLREARPGDCVAFVCTKTDKADVENQGRLLGVAEIGRDAVYTLDLIQTEQERKNALLPNGQPKWPHGVPMVEAWAFDDKPLLMDVIDRQLPRSATQQAVKLSPESQRAIELLPATKIELPDIPLLADLRRRNQILAGRSKGPKPSAWKGVVERNKGTQGYTYVFRFGDTDCWKIGRTINIENRLSDVNKHVPHEVLNDARWHRVYEQEWDSEDLAHDMEQKVLDRLEQGNYTVIGERVMCPEKDILAIWESVIARA